MTPTPNALGLVVSDMAAAVAFYRRLGLDFSSDTAEHEECELVGGFRLMLDTEASIQTFTADWVRPSGGPRAALAFQFDDPGAVDAKYGELIKAGYQGSREPWDAVWGHRYASVLDPDGNGVDLYAVNQT
jgi:catechol 2,3-dioxygenase-like lactoylglutathione lyase family enzyme